MANLVTFSTNSSKIQIDHSAMERGYFGCNVIIEVKDPNKISDTTLAGIAWDALEKVVEIATSRGVDPPLVVAAMLSNNKIYIYSSVKGSGNGGDGKNFLHNLLFKTNDPNDNSTLGKVGQDFDGRLHTFNARCGELMAIYGWELHNRDEEFKKLKGRVVSVERISKGLKSPCGTRLTKFGCKDVIERLEDLVVLPMSTKIPANTGDIEILQTFHTKLFPAE